MTVPVNPVMVETHVLSRRFSYERNDDVKVAADTTAPLSEERLLSEVCLHGDHFTTKCI